jgi:hypothetical protein
MSIITRQLDRNVGPKFLAISNQDLTEVVRRSAGDNLQILQPRTRNQLLITAKMPDFTVNEPELGGLLTPQLWVKNDNSGGSALVVGIGLYRFICMNGLYFGLSSFNIKLRHYDGPKAHGILDQLPQAIQSAIKAIESGEALDVAYDALETKVLDPISVVGNLPDVSNKVKQIVISNILNDSGREQDEPETAWGLYNQINEAARLRARSLYRQASNDIGMLDNIIALANAQQSLNEAA